MASQLQQQPARLSVLSFGTAPPPDVAQLPNSVPLNLYPSTTATAEASTDSLNGPLPPPVDLTHVARTVLKAKRVAVVCGAGISTASGIPDFRSGAGLFESLKKQYPDAKLSSGKDLFDVGLFASESNAAIFFNMIAELKKQTDAVQPTAFHDWLKHLDDQGKLFRVYTQNIDALEEKAGLTYGLGDKSLPLPPRRMGTAAPPPRSPSKAPTASSSTSTAQSTRTSTPVLGVPALSSAAAAFSVPLEPSSSQVSIASTVPDSTPRLSASPPPATAAAATATAATHSSIPRVIPLHGHLSTLSCSACKHEVALSGSYVDLLATGSAPICPACLSIDEARSAAGERSRGVGMMRPDVVLYGEEHKDGDRVGEITQRDLMGQRPDLLIVVGTTLKVKGTKRLVRELAKVIKPVVASTTTTTTPAESDSSAASTSTSGTKQTRASLAQEAAANAAAAVAASSSSQPRKRRPARPAPIHTLYLNYDFPTPAREWAGVFDCWLRGDIQEFVEAVKREEVAFKKELDEREKKRGEKRKRDADGTAAAASSGGGKKKASSGSAAKKVPAAAAAAAAAGSPVGSKRPLVPAHSAHPPSPLKPPPKPAPSPRTDPNKRTRSSVHLPALEGAVPGFGILPALPQLAPPHAYPSVPSAPTMPSTAFAPVAPYQHYQIPWQAPAGVFAPFTQLSHQQQQQQQQHLHQAAPPPIVPAPQSDHSASTGSYAASSSSVTQSRAAVWQGVPTWSPYAASDQTRSLDGSVETAPTTVGSSGVPSPVKAPNGEQQQAVSSEEWRASLRRKESSSSLSSLSGIEDEAEDEEVAGETALVPAPEATKSNAKRSRASLPARPRPSMSTRSSASASGSSDSNVASTTAEPASAQFKANSVGQKRRSSRSSTASSTLISVEAAAAQRRKSGSRSPIMSAAIDSIAVRAADRRRKSLTPPTPINGKTVTTVAVKASKLPYPVTKQTVAKVTGTATKAGRKRRGKSA